MHDLLYQNIMQYHDLFKKYTKITEVNLSLFVKYRYNLIYLYLSNTDKLSSVIFVYKAHYWALYHMWFQNKFWKI